MHLSQLELCGGSHSRGQAQVANDVTEGLSKARESAHIFHINNQFRQRQSSKVKDDWKSGPEEKFIRTSEFRSARRPSVWYDLGGP